MKRQEIKVRSLENALLRQKEAAVRKIKRLEKRAILAKVKKPSIKTLKKKLWALTSEIVRNSSHVCYTCDRILAYPNRQAGHHFSKGGHPGTIFDMENLKVQGSECNLFRSGHQVEFAYRLRKELGDERYEALYKRANAPYKWTREELLALIHEREEILNRMAEHDMPALQS